MPQINPPLIPMFPDTELRPREATSDVAAQTNPPMPHNPERLPREATRDTPAQTNSPLIPLPFDPNILPRETPGDTTAQISPPPFSTPAEPKRPSWEATRDTTSLTNPYYPIPTPLPDPQSLTREATEDTTSRRLTSQYSSLVQATATMFRPEKEIGPSPGVWQSLKAIVLASWLNLLLIFIPISWALHFAFAVEKGTAIFTCSFLAIIPLANLLAFATDELSLRVGQTPASLLNATLGNAVELLFAIISLLNCELQVVQSSLVGCILNNLLLVLGMCFFAGGIKFQEQGFGRMPTQLNSSLLAISVIAVLLPAAFHFSVVDNIQNDETSDILNVSRGTSIILLFLYVSYLFFQLRSHASLYAREGSSEDMIEGARYTAKKHNVETPIELQTTPTGIVPSVTSTAVAHQAENSRKRSLPDVSSCDVESGSTNLEKEEIEQPQLSVWITVGLLIVATSLVAGTVAWLVDSIDNMTSNGAINREFVGVILLPIICRTPDGVTIVTTSVKDQLNFSMGITVGSSIQIALFVIPFMVTLGWIMGIPLTLLFDPYESVVMFLAVLTVNYVVHYSRSNWLEGVILMCLYAILCVTFWFYPGNDPSGGLLAQCH